MIRILCRPHTLLLGLLHSFVVYDKKQQNHRIKNFKTISALSAVLYSKHRQTINLRNTKLTLLVLGVVIILFLLIITENMYISLRYRPTISIHVIFFFFFFLIIQLGLSVIIFWKMGTWKIKT